ncbi:Spore coat polysaccharide biosynthesis protein SpsG, predicted glycosyltransferase [Streptoalloteichus tenebrarius]|uniref:Putative glycosyltransferase n=1 Tax=Streptoalloteichus tenebrarius (strain ATCC 17920 / DSM 40477 / JCM 4838 / CBS 697.72 / NBRC 16177 / NCIMB 11028 / NRRL B-12390 / A12253. 1 / ISP 5477) TaxID=1933 RepID=Q2MFJ9_STRSD|nr:spore coat protein [Streptoalloteichus tenebrarius]MCP2261341.1 Spore coat polysaccharide biosynthesis protein SpsG, predicted glycosyltransferase [Streptoalloteichus tenebrarius]BFF00878.1 hypothetical protein GCM10020241_25530 [Streptoalloteichus tenebrarius]CAF33042.1 putative glycosyltransferase [Streptoalloteichus tenebrarius]
MTDPVETDGTHPSSARLAGRVVALRADASTAWGVGHVVRCLALAEEVTARGGTPVFVADLGDVAWLAEEVDARGLVVRHPPDTAAGFARVLRELDADAVVIDSYRLGPEHYTAARSVAPVVALYDRHSGPVPGDVLVDQTFGAERDPAPEDADQAVLLRGPRYALVRDQVRAARPATRPSTVDSSGRAPRVLLVLGGTDARGAAKDLTRLLLDSCPSLRLTVISNEIDADAFATGQGQHLAVLRPTSELPRLMASADLVVSAAGTSLAEICCVGAAAAALWVVDNQVPVYRSALAAGCVHGLGSLAEVLAAPDRAGAAVRTLLTSPRRRAELAGAAWELVDGAGRGRVLDALDPLLSPR